MVDDSVTHGSTGQFEGMGSHPSLETIYLLDYFETFETSLLMSLLSGLSEEINDDETIARFLISSNHFNASKVKPNAFLPNPKDGQTSVFRQPPEPVGELRQLGIENGLGNLHGAAMLRAGDIRQAGIASNDCLDVSSKEPPLRHGNIVGWPWKMEDRQYGKAQQKELALVLAKAAEKLIF